MIQITGTPNKISQGLNRVDARYFSGAGLGSQGRSVFTIARPSTKNSDGTITSYFDTFLRSSVYDIGAMNIGLRVEWVA